MNRKTTIGPKAPNTKRPRQDFLAKIAVEKSVVACETAIQFFICATGAQCCGFKSSRATPIIKLAVQNECLDSTRAFQSVVEVPSEYTWAIFEYLLYRRGNLPIIKYRINVSDRLIHAVYRGKFKAIV